MREGRGYLDVIEPRMTHPANPGPDCDITRCAPWGSLMQRPNSIEPVIRLNSCVKLSDVVFPAFHTLDLRATLALRRASMRFHSCRPRNQSLPQSFSSHVRPPALLHRTGSPEFRLLDISDTPIAWHLLIVKLLRKS